MRKLHRRGRGLMLPVPREKGRGLEVRPTTWAPFRAGGASGATVYLKRERGISTMHDNDSGSPSRDRGDEIPTMEALIDVFRTLGLFMAAYYALNLLLPILKNPSRASDAEVSVLRLLGSIAETSPTGPGTGVQIPTGPSDETSEDSVDSDSSGSSETTIFGYGGWILLGARLLSITYSTFHSSWTCG
jgi:hypothetical protein